MSTSHPTRVLLTSPRGFCAGVDRAIEIVRQALETFGPPVYVFHEIVHNPYVVQELRDMGAVFVNDLTEVPPGARAIYSAHGVSPTVKAQSEERALRVIDATCPLVTKVHLEAVRFAQEGFHCILVGHKGHDEVIGTMGEVPGHITLVSDVTEAETVVVPEAGRVALLTQTTLSVDDTREIIAVLRRRFPTLTFPPKEDICYATQNRQSAVKELAAQADLVLVLGASNSSNSQRLCEVAQLSGVPAYLINDIQELRPEWLEGVETVGITSGASTPEFLVQRAVEHFQRLGATGVRLLRTVEERVHFAMPRELQPVR
ncbi:MAG: 4-hydroxy-3-methylbut-2-enyl diphosphate reductase [Chloroflexi bacterium]|nr:4-hydroxy-3-methylbut-2-enyl diphosphate reductase [Chloroflexota bacterium]